MSGIRSTKFDQAVRRHRRNLSVALVFAAAFAFFSARAVSFPEGTQPPAVLLAQNEDDDSCKVVTKFCSTAGLIYALKHDEYKNARSNAAELLSERGAVEALPDLLDALRDPEKIVVEKAAKALATIGDERICGQLIENLHDPEPRVREYSAYVLGQIVKRRQKTGGYDVAEALASAAADENNLVRKEAVIALYELGHSSSKEIFMMGLFDEEPGVRRHSANALEKIRGRDAEEALVAALQRETDDDVRRSMMTALGGLGSSYAMDALVATLPHEKYAARVEIAAKLAETGTPRAIEVLSDLIVTDKYAPVRANAARGLLRAKEPSTVPVLVKALKDHSELVRIPASQALIDLADESILNNLLAAMGDTNPTVGGNASQAIIRMNSLDAVPGLIAMLDHPSKMVVGRAITVLEELTYRPYGSNTERWKLWYEENFKTSDD